MNKTFFLTLLVMTTFTACSKAPEATARDAGPDNAVTRYAETLAGSTEKARQSVDQMNAAISRQQQEMNSTAEQQP